LKKIIVGLSKKRNQDGSKGRQAATQRARTPHQWKDLYQKDLGRVGVGEKDRIRNIAPMKIAKSTIW